jgi:hypothetical protein
MAAIEMPPYIRSKKFDIINSQQLSPSGEMGFVQTLRRTSPFWGAEYDTGILEDLRWQEWQTFFDQLEGSMYTFLAYDPRRPMPYAYRHMTIASDPWTQSGQAAPRITAFDYANSTISLDRLATNAIITRGDYISVKIGNIWYLWRAQTNIVVGGTTASIPVRPRPNIMDFVASNIRSRRACMEMKMIGRPDETDAVDSFPSFSFRAAQFTARVPL